MAAYIIAPSLTSIFSKSILTGIYPNDWKTAKVTPLFEKGIKSDPNNYRPISVIPISSKVSERIVYNQLFRYLDDNKLLLGCQSASLFSYRRPKTCTALYIQKTAIQTYNALIIPHFDYCSPVWDCLSGYLSDKLQKLQNRAARIITKLPFDTSLNHLLSTLDWERLSLRREKQKALMMYKIINNLAPEYLQSLFSQHHSVYDTRNSEGRLALSKPNTNYLKRSFSYSGAMLWNKLPKNLKNASSINHFRRNLNVVDI